MGVQDFGESYIHGTDGRRQLSKRGDEAWVDGSLADQRELLDVGEIGHLVHKVDGYVPIDEAEG